MWNLLVKLYPLMTMDDCMLMDESQGEGPFISYWNIEKLGPQPTKQFLEVHKEEAEIEDLRNKKINELTLERDRRLDEISGITDPRKKSLAMSRQIKLLFKKLKDQTSPEEEQELDDMEILSNLLDDIDSTHDFTERFLEDEIRTLSELEVYDVSVDPSWP